ncbi:MAG: plasmid pRiA4b ORF-3 family protein [Spirochaetaceae bacterium]|nr:plasmid pRiA4b ORF-3 family protein [Spirochaetaceae bacterium]
MSIKSKTGLVCWGFYNLYLYIMTSEQEDALYDFLDTRIEPFTLKDAAQAAKGKDFVKFGQLKGEIADIFLSRRIVFPVSDNKWISRYGCFHSSSFVIGPSRLELLNGILIAGHRCVPFANPFVLPQDYKFFWKGDEIKNTTTEGAPEEFYPFFSIFGEEYAPQYIARDNPENELAFNEDPTEDPTEVSIKTLDMRSVYRETFFEPGNKFLVTIRDWKAASFDLTLLANDEWGKEKLDEWQKIAEDAFVASFKMIGPGLSTEEQIAWAYFCGGERMRTVPSYSPEDFLFEKTDKIEITAFGLESRFWYAGKEIPDFRSMEGVRTQPDETPIERMLLSHNIPISEYVIQAYVKDALFRNDTKVKHIIERIVPLSVGMNSWNMDFLAAYVANELDETAHTYSFFTDQKIGPLREQAAELHTAVIALVSKLAKGEFDFSLLPKHTFIVLSQIQIYSSGILEDMDIEVVPTDSEINAIESSMENMIDIFDELKEMIDKARENFRHNNISLVDSKETGSWRTVQISIGGTDIWRRVYTPDNYKLSDLEKIIHCIFNWSGSLEHNWFFEYSPDSESFRENTGFIENKTIGELISCCKNEFTYEYGKHWTVKIILSPCFEQNINRVVCAAGAFSAPPEKIEGPLRLRRFLNAINSNNESEKAFARRELGADYNPEQFNVEECNKQINILLKKSKL